MTFGYNFIATFLLSALIYWFIPKQRIRNLMLVLASLTFIFLSDRTAFVITILLTFYTYYFSILILRSERKSLYHKISLIGIITILAIFKYSGYFDKYIFNVINYFTHSGNSQFENILMPLGISYITFKYISYLTDLYWGINKRADFLSLLFYGSLFSIFVSGPIEKYEKIEKQISAAKIEFKGDYIFQAFERITYGIFKKFVIADWLGYHIGFVWRNPGEYSTISHILAMLGFSLQIYFDFAGYSDIAIGTSRAFGLKIMENFNNPYLRENITSFWRNWHISLSDWIRDYLFFPLSRFSTKKIWLLIFVPLIAMGVCGMWHGSEWKFLAWGLYHGAGISVYQFWNLYKKKRKHLKKIMEKKIFNIIAVIITFIFVTIGWVFFR